MDAILKYQDIRFETQLLVWTSPFVTHVLSCVHDELELCFTSSVLFCTFLFKRPTPEEDKFRG